MLNINKFGSIERGTNNIANVDSHHRWNASVRNYVRDNALCRAGADFDAKTRRIRRVAQPEADGDAVNKLYLEQSIQFLRGHQIELERSLNEQSRTGSDAVNSNDVTLLRNSILILRNDLEEVQKNMAAVENTQQVILATFKEYTEAFEAYKSTHGQP